MNFSIGNGHTRAGQAQRQCRAGSLRSANAILLALGLFMTLASGAEASRDLDADLACDEALIVTLAQQRAEANVHAVSVSEHVSRFRSAWDAFASTDYERQAMEHVRTMLAALDAVEASAQAYRDVEMANQELIRRTLYDSSPNPVMGVRDLPEDLVRALRDWASFPRVRNYTPHEISAMHEHLLIMLTALDHMEASALAYREEVMAKQEITVSADADAASDAGIEVDDLPEDLVRAMELWSSLHRRDELSVDHVAALEPIKQMTLWLHCLSGSQSTRAVHFAVDMFDAYERGHLTIEIARALVEWAHVWRGVLNEFAQDMSATEVVVDGREGARRDDLNQEDDFAFEPGSSHTSGEVP